MATGGRQIDYQADDSVGKLTCAICSDNFRRPKLLPCFHTFCQSCLQGVAGSFPTFPCPACRTIVLVPPAGIKGLQSNFYIEDASATSPTSPSPRRHLCDVCADEREATFSCLQCQQRFCLPCRQYHDSFAISNGHTTVPLTEEDEGCRKEISPPEKQKAALCPKHPDQPLLLHCSVCKVSLCLQCKLTQHEGHPTQDLADASAKVKDKLKDRLGTLAREILKLDRAVTAFHHRSSELQESRRAAEEGFRARADTLHRWVTQSLEEAVDSLQCCSQQLSKPWQDRAEQLSDRRLALQARQDHILRLLKDGQEADLLSLEARLSSRLEEEEEEEASLDERVMKEIGKSMPRLCAEYTVRAVNPVMVRSFIGVLEAAAAPPPPPQQRMPGCGGTEDPVLPQSALQQTLVAVGAQHDSDHQHQLPPSLQDSFASLVVPVNDSDLEQERDPSPTSPWDNLPPAVPVESCSSGLQQGRDQSPTSVLQSTSVVLPAQDSDPLHRGDCLSSAGNLTDPERKNPASDLDFSKKPASESDFSKNPASESDFSKKPANELDLSKKSRSESDFSKKPASDLDFSKKPANESDFSKKPANELDVSKNPASELAFSKNPASELDFCKKPAFLDFPKNPANELDLSKKSRSDSDFSKKPASELDLSKKPASESDFSKKPANELDFSKKPASESDFSKKPANESDFSKKPANESDFSKKSRSESDFSKKPANESDFSKKPANELDLSKKSRSESDFSKKPANESDFSKKPANESDLSKKSRSESDFSKNPASELDFSKKQTNESDFSKKPANELDFSKKPTNELDLSKKSRSESDFSKKQTNESDLSKNPAYSESDLSKKPAYSELHFSKKPAAREMRFSKNPHVVTVTACPVSQNRLWVLYRAVAGSAHHLQLLDADGQVLTTVDKPRSCPRLVSLADDTLLSWAQNSSVVHLVRTDGTVRAYDMGRKVGDLIAGATSDVFYVREVNQSRLHRVTFLLESSVEPWQTQFSVTSFPPSGVTSFPPSGVTSFPPSGVTSFPPSVTSFPPSGVTSFPPPGRLTHAAVAVSEEAALDSIPSRGVPLHASAGGRYFVFLLCDRVEVYSRAGSRGSAFVCAYRARRGPADARFCHTGGKEMLLVLVSAEDRVHVVDHTDGGRLARYLDTGPLNLRRPCRLAPDRHRRVWIVCEGARVVVVDL